MAAVLPTTKKPRERARTPERNSRKSSSPSRQGRHRSRKRSPTVSPLPSINKHKNIPVFSIEHDTIPIPQFIRYCLLSPPISPEVYPLYLRVKDILYYGTAIITHYKLKPRLETIHIYSGNENIPHEEFIMFNILEYNEISISTRKALTPLPGLKPLETIYYIVTFFYKMLGIEKYLIRDLAQGKCNHSPDEYYLFIGRIFSTSIPIHDKCIYYRFFKDSPSLHFLRDPTLPSMITELQQLTYPFDMGTMKITDFFKTMARDNAECAVHAPIINDMDSTLYFENPTYKKVHDMLTMFMVRNKDSIFYPKEKAANQP